jgi:hypothetical protein
MDKPIAEPDGTEQMEFEKALQGSAAKLWEEQAPVDQNDQADAEESGQ